MNSVAHVGATPLRKRVGRKKVPKGRNLNARRMFSAELGRKTGAWSKPAEISAGNLALAKATMTKSGGKVDTGFNTQARSKDVLGANSEIGRKLRQHYSEFANDAVPDRFLTLLSQLEESEKTPKGK